MMTTKEMRDRICTRMPGPEGEEIVRCLDNQAAAINSLVAWGTTLAAKLNADAGVTDVNYAAPVV